ncbi:hypothetical protein Nepgr_006254 [Nepenthes gracilis]|uniref:Uncharacterized protein n=1 Tax=Nepenthes gracilis TaxID=150966 RepID=A0AAD3S564_NEPGR|nr:hypothetical protein Nepgr_006254 [Nepenthes gracilis]
MERETETAPRMSATTKTTTWPIIHGYIDDTVAHESSLLSADDSDTVAVGPKPLLVLRRSDSQPCEITICFTQQHEIRQVYVKSTARVYEVYYAADVQSDNEYLCTVQCGMAGVNGETLEITKDEEVLPANNAQGSLCASSNVSNRHSDALESRNNGGSSTNEDGWVEVKVPESPCIYDGDTSLPKKSEIFLERGSLDFYEATAEISDADPCISITLRLVSIQSGESVYIDEVYVFADPVISADMDSPPNNMENSAGNALMSMLVPTLLQLSKSRISQMQNTCDSIKTETRVCQDAGTTLSGSAITFDKIQQERMLHATDPQRVRLEFPKQALDREDMLDSTSGVNFSCSHIEKTMDQIASRVAKIEDFCLRFEENMLKPITRMEARVEKIEQQMELLTKISHLSATASCTRISASEFSCNGLDSKSFHSGGNNYPCCSAPESCKNVDFPFDESSIPPNDMSLSASAAQLLPGLVFSAPEFSNVGDKEENDAIEAINISPEHILRKPLSIDDASASALSGFLSSTSAHPHMSARITEATPANFLGEGRGGNKVASALVQGDEPVIPFIYQNICNDTDKSLKSSPKDMSSSTSAAQLLPGLVFSAPEFANVDDEEENDAIDAINDSPEHYLRKPSSIDDALASALSGFLYSTSAQPHRSARIPEATPADFLGEEGGGDKVASSLVRGDEPVIPTIYQNVCNETDKSLKSSVVTSHEDSMKSGGPEYAVVDHDFEGTVESVDGEEHPLGEVGGKSCFNFAMDFELDQDEKGTTNDSHLIVVAVEAREAAIETGKTSISDVASEADASEIDFSSYKEVVEEGPDVLQDVSKLQSPSAVDFSIPILDVQFCLLENPITMSPLEALLSGIQEADVDAACVEERDVGSFSEQNHVVYVEGQQSASPLTINHQLVNLDDYVSGDLLLSISEEIPPDSPICSEKHGTFLSLI